MTARARWLLFLALCLALALSLGDYDLSALLDADERSAAMSRLASFASSFLSPELGGDYLAKAAELSVHTLAMAIAATALAVLAGFVLGVLGSRNVIACDARGGTARALGAFASAARFIQAVLRGVPDFAWAVMLIPVLGLGMPAGIAALAIATTGILARVYSEYFDAVPARAFEPIRGVGAGRLQTFFYAVLPSARMPMLSFTLLRWECNVRNAAVVGVVGGGGLGDELKVRLEYGEYDRVATLVLFLLLLTVSSDFLSQFVRTRLRVDPDHPRTRRAVAAGAGRRRALALAGTLIALSFAALLYAWPGFFAMIATAGGSLGDAGRGYAARIVGELARPDWSVLGHALEQAAIPLSLAFVGTLLAVGVAALLAYPASSSFQTLSSSFTGESPANAVRAARRVMLVIARGIAVVTRGVPEVLWALLIASFFRLGSMAGMLALSLHAIGILGRLFTESIDHVSLRRLETVHAATGSRAKTFAYGAMPSVAPDWIANSFFQFESNVRTAVVLGIVGVGGLGFHFEFNFGFARYEQAGTYVLVMVALSFALAGLSRMLGFARSRLAG